MSMWLGVDRAPAGLYIADSVVVKLAPEIFGSKSRAQIPEKIKYPSKYTQNWKPA